jgi:glycopeptide antibiotics resistance protein
MSFEIFKDPNEIENEEAIQMLFENRIRQLKVVTYGFTLALGYSIYQYLVQPGFQFDLVAKTVGIGLSWLLIEFLAGKHFIDPVIERKEELAQ